MPMTVVTNMPDRVLACGCPFTTGVTSRCGRCDCCWNDHCKCPKSTRKTIRQLEAEMMQTMADLKADLARLLDVDLDSPAPEIPKGLTKAEYQALERNKDNG